MSFIYQLRYEHNINNKIIGKFKIKKKQDNSYFYNLLKKINNTPFTDNCDMNDTDIKKKTKKKQKFSIEIINKKIIPSQPNKYTIEIKKVMNNNNNNIICECLPIKKYKTKNDIFYTKDKEKWDAFIKDFYKDLFRTQYNIISPVSIPNSLLTFHVVSNKSLNNNILNNNILKEKGQIFDFYCNLFFSQNCIYDNDPRNYEINLRILKYVLNLTELIGDEEDGYLKVNKPNHEEIITKNLIDIDIDYCILKINQIYSLLSIFLFQSNIANNFSKILFYIQKKKYDVNYFPKNIKLDYYYDLINKKVYLIQKFIIVNPFKKEYTNDYGYSVYYVDVNLDKGYNLTENFNYYEFIEGSTELQSNYMFLKHKSSIDSNILETIEIPETSNKSIIDNYIAKINKKESLNSPKTNTYGFYFITQNNFNLSKNKGNPNFLFYFKQFYIDFFKRNDTYVINNLVLNNNHNKNSNFKEKINWDNIPDIKNPELDKEEDLQNIGKFFDYFSNIFFNKNCIFDENDTSLNNDNYQRNLKILKFILSLKILIGKENGNFFQITQTERFVIGNKLPGINSDILLSKTNEIYSLLSIFMLSQGQTTDCLNKIYDFMKQKYNMNFTSIGEQFYYIIDISKKKIYLYTKNQFTYKPPENSNTLNNNNLPEKIKSMKSRFYTITSINLNSSDSGYNLNFNNYCEFIEDPTDKLIKIKKGGHFFLKSVIKKHQKKSKIIKKSLKKH